jgi:hypothetical protein
VFIRVKKLILERKSIKMKRINYITVLDFEVGEVFQYKIGDDWLPDSEAFEDFIVQKGHRLKDVHWMCHESDRIIKDN